MAGIDLLCFILLNLKNQFDWIRNMHIRTKSAGLLFITRKIGKLIQSSSNELSC